MSSGLIYAFQYMADYPEKAAKVRQEQLEVRGDADASITLEILDQSPYLRAFVKEVLRIRRKHREKPSKSPLSFANPAYTDIFDRFFLFTFTWLHSSRHHGTILCKERFPY